MKKEKTKEIKKKEKTKEIDEELLKEEEKQRWERQIRRMEENDPFN